MVRIKICIVLFLLLFGCSAHMSHQISEIPTGEAAADRTPASAVKANHPTTSEKPSFPVLAPEFSLKAAPVPSEKSEVSIREESLSLEKEPPPKATSFSPERAETIKPDQKASPPQDHL